MSQSLLVLAGPTGTGKSQLALEVAELYKGVIINADARQVYADFPILTAQPSPEEYRRVPHRLYGFLPSTAALNAASYAELAHQEIARVAANGQLPLLVGGSGFYIQAVLQGLSPVPHLPAEISHKWREACATQGSAALHRLLAERDPAMAARLHPNDSQRVTRALEVLEGTGRSLAYWQSLPPPPSPYQAVGLCLTATLEELTPRLARRIEQMLQAGAIREAQQALKTCPEPTAPGWTGIGCAELYRYLTGQCTLQECKTTWLANTRAYAKRQLTWWRRTHFMVLPAANGAEQAAEVAHALSNVVFPSS